jgi:hypothetical protein
MSDSPFTRLQNLTRKPESGISALRLLTWPQRAFVAQRICFFSDISWSQDFCLHPFSYSLSFLMKPLP